MKTFMNYVKNRSLLEDLEGNDFPSANFKLNSEDDIGTDYDHALMELIKALMSKYESETMRFINDIANRGDQEIEDLVQKLNKDGKPSELREPQHPTDFDNEVVPPIADTGYSDDGGGGE